MIPQITIPYAMADFANLCELGCSWLWRNTNKQSLKPFIHGLFIKFVMFLRWRNAKVKAMPIYQDFPSNAFPAFVLRKMKNPQLTMA